MKYLIFLFITGCTTFEPGPFNTEHQQDQTCYTKLGGQKGYCDAIYYKPGETPK